MVGRESEVALLVERWQQAKDGQGQVILLSGEAGIGKISPGAGAERPRGQTPHTRWECRSSPYYQNTALYPIIDLIQRTLRWQPDDTPEEQLATLERQLRQYQLPVEESIPLFAPLLSLQVPEDRYPPLNLSPQRQRQKTLESIVAILLELAERRARALHPGGHPLDRPHHPGVPWSFGRARPGCCPLHLVDLSTPFSARVASPFVFDRNHGEPFDSAAN